MKAALPLTADGFTADVSGLAQPVYLLLDDVDGLPTVHRMFAVPFYDQRWRIRYNDRTIVDLSRVYLKKSRACREAIVTMNRHIEQVISKINATSKDAEHAENFNE